MGHIGLLPIPLVELIERHGARSFVETGAGFEDGGGVRWALRSPQIQKAIAIDVRLEALVDAAWHVSQEHGQRLDAGWAWEFILGHSVDVLPRVLQTMSGPTVWWLDAHFPALYGATVRDPRDEMPLAQELAIILDKPQRAARDVILIDDWRLYADPRPHTRPGVRVALPGVGAALIQALEQTHEVRTYPHGEGYLIAQPRRV